MNLFYMGPCGTQDHRGPHKTSKDRKKAGKNLEPPPWTPKYPIFRIFFFNRWAHFLFLIAFKH